VSRLTTYSDGGARGNPGPAAIGVVLVDEAGHVVFETARCIGSTTNNKAEYQAMILALESAREQKARQLTCIADSQLLIYQLQGRYRIKDLTLKALAEKVKSLASQFESVVFRQVPRENPMISRADKLLNQALDRARRSSASGSTPPPAPSGPAQTELF
jgi:ribonuclease HI